MEHVLNKAEGLVSHLKEYADIRLEEVKLEVADKSSKVMAALIVRAVVFVVIVFIVLLGSMAVAYLLGESWDRVWLGFLAVSGFYVLLAILIWLTRERVIRIPIVNTLLHQMTKKEKDDDDD